MANEKGPKAVSFRALGCAAGAVGSRRDLNTSTLPFGRSNQLSYRNRLVRAIIVRTERPGTNPNLHDLRRRSDLLPYCRPRRLQGPVSGCQAMDLIESRWKAAKKLYATCLVSRRPPQTGAAVSPLNLPLIGNGSM